MGVARARQSAVGGSRGLMGKRPSADLVGRRGGRVSQLMGLGMGRVFCCAGRISQLVSHH